MTILFSDGMDLIGDTSHIINRYDAVDGATYEASGGRYGGGAINMFDDDRYLQVTLPSNPTTFIISYAVRRNSVGTQLDTVAIFDSSVGSGVINFRSVSASPNIQVRRGSTVLGTFSLAADGWHWFSMKVFVHDSTGTIDIEIDDVSVLSLSGIDTLNSGSAFCGGVRLGATTVDDFKYDDIIITDGGGSAPFNDILSDRRIETILPDGAGDSTDWAVSGAATNREAVDEVPPDDDTSYVEDSVSAELDLYTMASMTGGLGSIDAVQVVVNARNPDGGTNTLILKAKTGTTEEDSATKNLSSGFAYYTHLMLVDPDTSIAWTESGVNGMQAGVEIP